MIFVSMTYNIPIGLCYHYKTKIKHLCWEQKQEKQWTFASSFDCVQMSIICKIKIKTNEYKLHIVEYTSF